MFWENFYNECEKRNTTPAEVVKDLGIAGGSITKWKNGSMPSSENLIKIADYFNVSVDYLLGRQKEINKTNNEKKDSDFYRMLFSDDGMLLIRKRLINRMQIYGYDRLAKELHVDYRDIKTFLLQDLNYGTQCQNNLDKLLMLLETNIYTLFKEGLSKELTTDDVARQYFLLDEVDKAEIRGEIKQMLKQDKYNYNISHDIAAFGGDETEGTVPPVAKDIT